MPCGPFEAAARHLSYVKAADELFVTPAALSHQVKRLEAYLGVPLFRRLPRGLLLTDAGQQLLPELRDAFLRLDLAIDRVRDSDQHGALTISVAPVFATKWLLPRLDRFDGQHPDIDLRISSSLNVVDFARDAFDAAVRLGGGDYPGLKADKLFDESVTPMCSPRLLDDLAARTDPAILKRLVLLHDDSMSFDSKAPTWKSWLLAAGISDIDASRGPRFGQPDHALQAAIDGAGIVLGWQTLANNDIEAGRLVTLFDVSLPLGSAFYLVYPTAFDERAKIRLFRSWLLSEVRVKTENR